MQPPFTAFIFDLNGTMINDMEYHIRTWYHVLVRELGASMSVEEVRAQMYGSNKELLVRVFGPHRFSEEEMERIPYRKEEEYQEMYRPYLALIPGLDEFLARAHAGKISMAIASAAIPFNIDYVLDNLNIRSYFKAIVSAHDVKESKPHPETYLEAASRLGVSPRQSLVFEDAPKGVESAMRAGSSCIALTTLHSKEEFKNYSNILRFISDFRDPWLEELFPKN
jgi:beta-phosphoglucomutase family hydrolase